MKPVLRFSQVPFRALLPLLAIVGSAGLLGATTVTLRPTPATMRAGDHLELLADVEGVEPTPKIQWLIYEDGRLLPCEGAGPLYDLGSGMADLTPGFSNRTRTFVVQAKCGMVYSRPRTIGVTAASAEEGKEMPDGNKRARRLGPPATRPLGRPASPLLALPRDLQKHIEGFSPREFPVINHDFSVAYRNNLKSMKVPEACTDTQLYQLLHAHSQLQELELGPTPGLTRKGIMDALMLNRDLEALTLTSHHQLQAEDLLTLASSHRRLGQLSFMGTTPASAEVLTAFSNRLRVLAIAGPSAVTGMDFRAFPRLLSLTVLGPTPHFTGKALPPGLLGLEVSDAENFIGVGLPPFLEQLSVTGCRQFTSSLQPDLSWLRLVETATTEDQLIDMVSGATTLQVLITDVPISDRTIQSLPASLRDMVIGKASNITEGHFQHLTSLERLDMEGCGNLRNGQYPPNLRHLTIAASGHFAGPRGLPPSVHRLTIDSDHLFQQLGLGSKISDLELLPNPGFTPEWFAKALQQVPNILTLNYYGEGAKIEVDTAVYESHRTLWSVTSQASREYPQVSIWRRPASEAGGAVASDGLAPLEEKKEARTPDPAPVMGPR